MDVKIGYVSTYTPIECGIATYSSYPVKELRKKFRLYIVSEYGAEGSGVYNVYDSQDPDLAHKIYQTLVKLHPNLVHIQHEFGLYGALKGVNVIPLIYNFKLSRIPVAVTIHTVYEDFSYENKLIVEAIIRASDAVIVHEEYQKESILKNIGDFNNLYVIPHGVRETEFIKNAKSSIGVEGKKVILLMGFFRPSKNFEQIIRVFPKIKQKVPDSVLVVAGDVRLGEYSEYMDGLVRMINESESRDSIRFIKGKFSQDRYDEIVCSADVAVLPYRISAQSGVMAHFLAYGIPIVSSDLRLFKDNIQKFEFGFVCKTDQDYIEGIASILTEEKLQNRFSSEIKRYVKDNLLWEKVAHKTAVLYQQVINQNWKNLYPQNR